MPATLDLPRVDHAEIVIDGRADDAAWAQALALPDFVTFQPVPGRSPVGQARVRVLADDEALYLLTEVDDPEPERIRATLGRRDSRFDDDFVGFYLDPGAEGQRAYVFIVNPLGLQMDGIAVASGDEDYSWDTHWQSLGRRTDQGYTVEVAIPWRSIRHEQVVDRTGLFVFRKRSASAERSSWPVVDQEIQGLLVQQAVLTGPGELGRTVGLDLTPELTFGWTDQGPDDSRWGLAGVSPGLTVQWAPTPADAIMATLNPDFSQVESDATQIAVNRRYALYYDEKRPFFLEGQEWFESPLGDLVYTRAMVAPRTGIRATTSRAGWALAALNVWDASPGPSVSEGGGWTEADLEGHDAVSTLLRGRGPLGSDGYLGAFYSDRTVLGADLANRVGGADARVRLSDRWVVEGAAAGSHTTLADGSAIAGPAAALSVDYDSEHLWLDTDAELIGPDFRAENGFVTRADRVGSWVESGYSLFPDGKVVRRLNLLPVDLYAYWHTDGRMRDLIVEPDVSFSFANGTWAFVEYQYNNELYQDQWFTFHRWEGGGGGQVNRWLYLEAFAGGGQDILYDPAEPKLGQLHWVYLGPAVQPVHWLELGTELTWERFVDPADGQEVYAGATSRFKVEAFASRRVWTRLLVDHDSFADTTSGEALLAWELAPGRAFYLGAGTALQAEPTWGLFAKGSWVLSR